MYKNKTLEQISKNGGLFFVLYHFLCNLLLPLGLYFNINAMYCMFARIISYVIVISNDLHGCISDCT
mgnify:CR=1 FL=1